MAVSGLAENQQPRPKGSYAKTYRGYQIRRRINDTALWKNRSGPLICHDPESIPFQVIQSAESLWLNPVEPVGLG